MIAAFLASVASLSGSVVERSITFGVSPYPPSFDNNPLLFGWALFARMLIVTLASATLARVVSRTRSQGLPMNHPVVLHRITWCSFMCASGLGGLSDTLTYLFWGEVSPDQMQVVLSLSRLCDALTMFPFMTGLFTPLVVGFLIRAHIAKAADRMTLNSMVHDIKSTWDTAEVPIRLFVLCALATAGVTAAKYGLWLGHGHP